MRSLLFVPADNPRKLAKAESTSADALVFDLEDAVLPESKPAARKLLAGFLSVRALGQRAWVRVNEPGSTDLLADLAAVVPLRPRGIVLPKIRGPQDVLVASAYLTMAETIHNILPGELRIIAVCTETSEAVLRMSELAAAHLPRLTGLIWGGEDLSSAIGAVGPRLRDGSWGSVYEHARSQCLLAANALGVLPIDTVFVDVRDNEGCRASALRARADGFGAKIAVHPDQIEIINSAFTPSDAEIAFAHRVITAFASGQGAVVIDGKMLDLPHLKAARRLLAAIPDSSSTAA